MIPIDDDLRYDHFIYTAVQQSKPLLGAAFGPVRHNEPTLETCRSASSEEDRDLKR